MSEFFSAEELAAYLGYHANTIRNWARNGEIPALRTPGGQYIFRLQDVLRVLSNPTPDEGEDED